ncbi:MAG: hypothetical protein CMJ40_05170 [Phycisphaerae bacterium]|nr:hypothetical protein [Phycisphaerae bacterium]
MAVDPRDRDVTSSRSSWNLPVLVATCSGMALMDCERRHSTILIDFLDGQDGGIDDGPVADVHR